MKWREFVERRLFGQEPKLATQSPPSANPDSVIPAVALPSGLIAAATYWEARLQAKNIQSKKINRTEWSYLAPEIRSLIPLYLIELLANHALVGPGFRINSNRRYSYLSSEFFSFWPVYCYGERFLPFLSGMPGFCPISDGENGDKWLIKQTGDPGMSVYLYDLSGREIKQIEPTLAAFLNNLKLFV